MQWIKFPPSMAYRAGVDVRVYLRLALEPVASRITAISPAWTRGVAAPLRVAF
jgi:hypothetical protein